MPGVNLVRLGDARGRGVQIDRGRRASRSLGDDHVHVRLAEAKGADPGAPHARFGRPRPRLHDRKERCAFELEARVDPLAVQGRRQRPVMQRQRHLDELAIPAAESRWPTLVFTLPMAQTWGILREDAGQGAQLDRMADHRPGAVSLDIRHGARRRACFLNARSITSTWPSTPGVVMPRVWPSLFIALPSMTA